MRSSSSFSTLPSQTYTDEIPGMMLTHAASFSVTAKSVILSSWFR